MNLRALFLALFAICTQASAPLYTSNYPANKQITEELGHLRAWKKLTSRNETIIKQNIKQVSQPLHMPEAILWCLLFQESRLNHLIGVEKPYSAQGIGQFIQFSFFEINHELERYAPNGQRVFIQTLGRDVRPIAAMPKSRNHPSSYFNIPTAVVSSALFLNNRYLHLKRLLEKQKVTYNSDVLWLYAAMAYNKGSRTVLSFWNEYRKLYGTRGLEKLLGSAEATFSVLDQDTLFQAAIRRIWSEDEVSRYAFEAKTHLKNIYGCSINDKTRRKKG